MIRRAAGVAIALLAWAAAAVLAAAPPATKEAAAPDFNARGRRFVEAVNSTDAALRAEVLKELFTPEVLAGEGQSKHVGLLDRLRERYQSLEFHHAEAVRGGDESAPRLSLHLYARSAKDGGWKDLQFKLEPAPPHRIVTIVFIADVAEPVYLPNGDIDDPSTLAWLGAYMDKLAAADDLAASLLIARGDQILFQRACGYADSARTRRIGPKTRMNLGSGGKMFTALVIAGLVEQRRLSFTDTLARVLPLVADQPFARKVTIGHLLSHTSGIGELWTDEYERHWHELRSLKDYLPFVLKAGTNFAPGERFEYSNSNFILAGLVAEAVTGKTYDELLAQRIFQPLGMRDTGLFPFDDADTLQAQRLARAANRTWRKAPHGYRGSSAGGGLSTATDMLAFARGLVGGRVVSAATLATMTASRTTGLPGSGTRYGYGFILEGTGPSRSYGHGGIASGVNFELRYFPQYDITLIAFSNQDNGAYDDLRRNAIKLITGDR